LVTNAALTAGNVADGPAGVALVEHEQPGLEIYADTAYGSGDTRAALRAQGHDLVIKPIPMRTPIPGGFNRDDFAVAHHTRTATPPPPAHPPPSSAKDGARSDLPPPPSPPRQRRTTSQHEKALKTPNHNNALVSARQSWTDPIVVDHYRHHRPMVERTIAWLV